MKLRISIFVLLVLLAGVISAQDLTVTLGQIQTQTTKRELTTTRVIDQTGLVISQSETLGPESTPIDSVSPVINVETRAANVRLNASDQERRPVMVTELADGKYTIQNQTGKVWVRVTAVDFSLNIFDETMVIVEPVGPPTPPRPPTPDVSNKMGVGLTAAKFAPSHDGTRAIVAAQYRQAGNFLFGIPELKPVASANGGQTVFDWLSAEAAAMQCPNPQVCEQWGKWRVEIVSAMNASQRERGAFDREDWFTVFEEIANALEQK